MNAAQEYERWRSLISDPELSNELSSMAADSAKIEDAFYRELEFGTGGLRGVLGVGTNRMNIHTVTRATLGLAAYIKECGGSSAAIGYDTRINSLLFATTAARVLAEDGIKAYLYSSPLPTPTLSYAVRKLGASAGIMITASHNPKIYNGYKVYGSDGCQITDAAAEKILAKIKAADYFVDSASSFDSLLASGMIEYISDSVMDDYIADVGATSVLFGDAADKSVGIVYTPLNGTGYAPVSRILKENGFTNVAFVKEQTAPDGNFPTCPYPNPEMHEALEFGIRCMKESEADILLATDPDSDRVGVAVKDGDGVRIFTGNEVGLLLFDYIASQRKKHEKMPHAPLCVKTIVTTELAKSIASEYGVSVFEVLTGFKYIGEKIGDLESQGSVDSYVFGFEESCGYLGGSYVRDKDGVFASLLVSEMAAFYKAKGLSLLDVLTNIYKKHGYAQNSLYSYSFSGSAGAKKMAGIMSLLRGGVPYISGIRVSSTEDFSKGLYGLPKSDVLRFNLEGKISAIVRPSGTEPKLKIYLSVSRADKREAERITERIKSAFDEIMR